MALTQACFNAGTASAVAWELPCTPRKLLPESSEGASLGILFPSLQRDGQRGRSPRARSTLSSKNSSQ
jgi:hypothetical protein